LACEIKEETGMTLIPESAKYVKNDKPSLRRFLPSYATIALMLGTIQKPHWWSIGA
jgi:hypothetical protein